MTRKRFWLVAVALLGATLLSSPRSAAVDPPIEIAPKDKAGADDVETLAEAYRLAEIAEKHESPEAYVSAGILVLKFKALTGGQVRRPETRPEVQDEDGKPIKGAKVENTEMESLDALAKQFFDSASRLGLIQKTSPQVEALIKAAKARKYEAEVKKEDIESRKAVGGPRLYVCTLPPKQSHVYDITFDTYTLASVGFQASAPIRCKLHHGSYVHFEQVLKVGQYAWKPSGAKETKTFRIVIKNPSNDHVKYKFFTN